MNAIVVRALKIMRKYYIKSFGVKTMPKLACEQDPNRVAQSIYETLTADKPGMVARFGNVELNCLSNYWTIKHPAANWLNYVRGKGMPLWWEFMVIESMHQNA